MLLLLVRQERRVSLGNATATSASTLTAVPKRRRRMQATVAGVSSLTVQLAGRRRLGEALMRTSSNVNAAILRRKRRITGASVSSQSSLTLVATSAVQLGAAFVTERSDVDAFLRRRRRFGAASLAAESAAGATVTRKRSLAASVNATSGGHAFLRIQTDTEPVQGRGTTIIHVRPVGTAVIR